MRPMQARATLEDVARVAGVSRATASRAVRGGESVSAANLEAVRRAVSELGYVPNPAARSLVTRQTDTIAVVVPEHDSRIFSDPFIASAIAGVAEALEDTPKQVVLLMRSRRRGNERMTGYLLGGHVDGIVVVSHHRDDHLPQVVARTGLPAAFIGRPLDADVEIPYVDLDNRAGGRMAAEHLIAAGARRIATVTGPLDMVAAVDRLAGWSAAMLAAGLDDSLRYEGDFTLQTAEEVGRRLLAEHPEVDAVFAANDLTAVGLVNVLRKGGRRVPDDVRIIGFDDTPLCLGTHPQLTSLTNPAKDLAHVATRMVLDQLASRPVESPVILRPALVARASA